MSLSLHTENALRDWLAQKCIYEQKRFEAEQARILSNAAAEAMSQIEKRIKANARTDEFTNKTRYVRLCDGTVLRLDLCTDRVQVEVIPLEED